MKKAFKWIIGIIVVLIVASIAFGGEDDSTTTTTTDTSKEAPKTEAKEEKESGKVTREQFDQIVTGDALTGEGGMTIEEVEAILGKGEKMTESSTNDMTMEFYTWDAEGDFGATVTVDFTNGKAASKSNFGLK
jgi:hypothetical protein